MCKIIIVDNYPLFSSGLTSILKIYTDFTILCEVRNADDLRRIGQDLNPDVIIIDILHLDNGGIKPIKKIRKTYPSKPILLILSDNYNIYFEEYIRSGVKGFIFKEAKPEEFINAIKKLHGGEDYFSNKVWMLLKELIRSQSTNVKQKTGSFNLSDRELSVLKHFCQGLTYKEIGNRLHISSRTVESHKKNIQSKLNLKSTVEMVKFAMANNIT